jgi:hypothetical protein
MNPSSCPAWQSIADLPQDVEAASATSDGTFVYVVGGYSFSFGDVNAFRRYDPAANAWTSLAPMPVSAAVTSAVYYPPTQKIYVFGGQRFSNGVTFEVTIIYDIATNTWSAGAFMPDVRGSMASGYNSANGKIYLVSGYNGSDVSTAQADTWEYDPVTNVFTTRAPIPHPVGGTAFGIINGHMFVAGGRDANNVVIDSLWDYDIAANAWTERARMPCGQQNIPGSAVALGKLWVFGGGNPFRINNSRSTIPPLHPEKTNGMPATPNTTSSGRFYDPQTNSWGYGVDMSVERSFPAATAIGSKLFAIGGASGFTLTSGEMADACVEVPVVTPLPNYVVATSSGASIVPGTTDIGNHCDDCTTEITLPFPVKFYDEVFTTADVSSNGLLEFTPSGAGCCGSCLPDVSVVDLIAAHWSDLYTGDDTIGEGIFTSVSGTAPNRVFNIEWRATYCCGGAPTENFEIRLYESQNQIDLIYGSVASTLPMRSAKQPSGFGFGIGVQRDTGSCYYTAIACATPPVAGTLYRLTIPAAPAVSSAVSRKTHGGSGDFDIPLPLTGNVGVECRNGGGTNDYTMVIIFGTSVNVTGNPQAQVTLGSGNIGSGGTSNGGAVTVAGSVVTIPLTNIANAQRINVTLRGVGDGAGSGDVVIPMGILLGDTSGNGAVTSTDVTQTKAQSGQPVSAGNFRSDVSANGAISATDVTTVKLRSGTALP